MLRGALLRRRAGLRATASCPTRGARCASSAAAEECGETDENHAAKPADAAATPVTSRGTTTRRASPLPTPIATAMALADQLEHPESSRIGRSLQLMRAAWMPEREGSGLTHEELMRAKKSLERLRQRVELECSEPTGAHEPTEEKRILRRQKATTRRLGRTLAAMLHQESYKEIEGVAFLWDELFPEYARNENHWSLLCQYYALALNKQQRYQEVIDKFFTEVVSLEGDDEAPRQFVENVMLTRSIVSALLAACGEIKDATTAIRVLRLARDRDLLVSHNAVTQLLGSYLRGDDGESFDAVVEICDVVVRELDGRVPAPAAAKLIKIAAERNELHRVMPYYSLPEDEVTEAEGVLEHALHSLWHTRHVDEMLFVLKDLLQTSNGRADLKIRLCKTLLRKSVEEREDDCHEQAMKATLGVLELMENHRIRASNKPFPALVTALIEDRHIDTMDGFLTFFKKYPHVMEVNAFVVCELLLVSVRLNKLKLIDEIVAYALDNGIPIKYVALESVAAYYYRTGKFESVEKAANIIQALRKNKHIPLGIALTEIGMSCNLKLGRHAEAILLFEDFAKIDAEKKRVLTRRPMLQAAKTAYTKLRRHNEANAVRQLLQEHFPSLLTSAYDVNDEEDEESEEEDEDDEYAKWEAQWEAQEDDEELSTDRTPATAV